MKWYDQAKVGDVFMYQDGARFYGVFLEVTKDKLSWQWFHKNGAKANLAESRRKEWSMDTLLDKCTPVSSLVKELM